jgi:hypothetical protein
MMRLVKKEENEYKDKEKGTRKGRKQKEGILNTIFI